MIILDTNIVSEMMRCPPDAALRDWMDRHSRELWMNAVSVHETRFGLARMPVGARRQGMESAFEKLLDIFADRIADLDRRAAEAAGSLVRPATIRAGRWKSAM